MGEFSFSEKTIKRILYFTSPNMGARSEFSQDVGRSIDKLIGAISCNPCRGCDLYYEETHGKPRWMKSGLKEPTPNYESQYEETTRAEVVRYCHGELDMPVDADSRKQLCHSVLGFLTEE